MQEAFDAASAWERIAQPLAPHRDQLPEWSLLFAGEVRL